jgi:hypothetical protein
MKSIRLAIAVYLSVISVPADANTVLDWRWLNGTTWYVPTSGLPAYIYTPLQNTITPVQDQTVYTITGYRNGYFWGRTAGQVGTNDISCMSLVGSVTPEGSIYLTFTPFPFSPGDEPTIGVGTMVRKSGKWTMQNQMSTGTPSLQLGHWAYMVQTNPDSASWSSLPGVGVSVPEFMSACLDAAPTATPP